MVVKGAKGRALGVAGKGWMDGMGGGGLLEWEEVDGWCGRRLMLLLRNEADSWGERKWMLLLRYEADGWNGKKWMLLLLHNGWMVEIGGVEWLGWEEVDG